MEKNFTIQATKLLVVEGKDELNFFVSLLRYEHINGVQLVDIGGKDKFKVELLFLTKLYQFRNVNVFGLVRDAEDLIADSAFASVCEALKKSNLPAPPSLNSLAEGKPRTGIFVMPDNKGSGRLEDLCLQSLAGQNILDCITAYISCLSTFMDQVEKEKFIEPKARVLSYLASRAPIVNSLGLGAQNGYWDFSHPCFSNIKQFLHSLFDNYDYS